jgi:transposase
LSERSDGEQKAEALRKHRALNPTPERVTDERFQADEFFDARDLVQVKYEMLRRVRRDGATVTEAAEAFGFSRPTFYQAREALEEEGLAGLAAKQPGPKGAHKLRENVLEFVEGLRTQSPELRSREWADRIEERFGVSVHPRSIERALARREKKRQGSG